MTHAHRAKLLQENPQVDLIVLQCSGADAHLGRFVVFGLRVPHEHLGAVAGLRFDVLHPEADTLQELVLLVAGLERHRHVRAGRHVLQADGETGHVDGPLALRRPRVEETLDFALQFRERER